VQKGQPVTVKVLEVLCQAAAAIEPREGAFDHPAFGQHLEAACLIRALHDLDREPWQRLRNRQPELRSLVAAVSEKLGQEREQTEQARQHQRPAIAILDACRMHHGVQQQTYGIDQDMPLLALDLLAGVVTMRINAGPPFSALFTL